MHSLLLYKHMCSNYHFNIRLLFGVESEGVIYKGVLCGHRFCQSSSKHKHC